MGIATSAVFGSGLRADAKTAHPHHQLECAGIIVAAIPAGTPDGRQQAGFLKSELGRVELRADVRNGTASNYTLSLPGQSLIDAARPWPPAVITCLKAKAIAAAPKQTQDCRGNRFEIVISRAESAQYLMLYAMTKPGPWRLCRAATVAGDSGPRP